MRHFPHVVDNSLNLFDNLSNDKPRNRADHDKQQNNRDNDGTDETGLNLVEIFCGNPHEQHANDLTALILERLICAQIAVPQDFRVTGKRFPFLQDGCDNRCRGLRSDRALPGRVLERGRDARVLVEHRHVVSRKLSQFVQQRVIVVELFSALVKAVRFGFPRPRIAGFQHGVDFL